MQQLNPKLVSSLKKENFMLPPKHQSSEANLDVADERHVQQKKD
jgi:hypothetical protein